ncbi:hypothetical protein V5O48_011061 [Marasmius crinis-equi]|uniref:DUF1793-domain-containing protein n=1 Tax=Marasmius crinis-equi TaxID=585013 RepID=A0ABR3F6K8_9AGAR
MSSMVRSFAFLAFLSLTTVCAALQPPAIPLAVRSPFFSSWLPARPGDSFPSGWPKLWTTNDTVGMGGLMRVDGELYNWLGAVWQMAAVNTTSLKGKTLNTASVKTTEITPTKTILTVVAGQMEVAITFLSPLEPEDLVLQSFPFSYISFDAKSIDGQPHSLQVHLDASGEWISNTNQKIQWETQQDDQAIVHAVRVQLGETINVRNGGSNVADDGTLYFATAPGSGVTWQTASDAITRVQFLSEGLLANTADTNFRPVATDFLVVGIAYDFGSITSTSSPAVLALGVARDPAIFENGSSGTRSHRPYFTTKYNSVTDGIKRFLSDFPNAIQRSTNLDQRILAAAGSVSSNYADIISLATRQTFAGVETAVVDGTPMMFMKDVGNSQRIAPVETMYASFPAFLYVNPSWGKYLLEPLLRFQASFFPNSSYAASQLGPAYPGARATTLDPRREIEDSGSTLIMAWAHAKYSTDKSLITLYYETLKAWTENLIPKTLAPSATTMSADGQQVANITNLALKGIIGIRAMADISNALDEADDAKRYLDVSSSYAKQWEALAGPSSVGHLTSTYGQTSSGGMMYNLYADKWLETNLISKGVYDAQTNYHSNQPRNPFGLAFDTNSPTTGKSHWTLFTAGTMTSTTMRDLLVKSVYDKALDQKNLGVFPTTYSISSGEISSGNASPAQGGVFVLLALTLESKIPGMVSSTNSATRRKIGAIVGGTIGGVAFFCLLLAAVFFVRRRRRAPEHVKVVTLDESDSVGEIVPFNYQYDAGSYKEGEFIYLQRQEPAGRSLFEETSPPLTSPNTLSPVSSIKKRSLPAPPTMTLETGQSHYTSGKHRPLPQPGGSGSFPTTLSRKQSELTVLSPAESGSSLELVLSATDSSYDIGRYDNGGSGREAETHQLRADIETLRRELRSMRTVGNYEPPPSYS